MQGTLKDIVSEIRSLEPFPGVALRVLELSSRSDVVPNELIEIIQTDAGLTGKVLKLCNSAYYGFQREIASLQEAGNMLGVQTLVNLVLTSSTNRYFRDYGSAEDRSSERLWRSSVANALASRLIARKHRQVDEERAYTAGLLQNIGHLVLDRFLTQERDQVLARVDQGSALLEAEQEVLGLHHAELGARLATRWTLPDVLVDTIRFHHNPRRATIDPVLCATIHLAETLSWAVGTGELETPMPYDVSLSAFETTGISPDEYRSLDEDLRRELARASDFLEA